MKSRDYWRGRMEAQAARQLVQDEALSLHIKRQYDELMHTLDRELSVFYGRYAANEAVTMAEARRLLSNAEMESFRISLDEFRAKATVGGFDKELNEIYLRSRVSRLQALQSQIGFRVQELYQSQRDLLHDHLAASYTETYYRTIFEIQKGVGFMTTFARLDSDTIEQILSRPWLKDNFSGRIWKNRDKLLTELETTLAQAFTRGDSLDKSARLLAKRMDVSISRAMSLVATESAHLAAQATARGYAETGVDAYDYLVTLDERTCPVCAPLDGRMFRRTEMRTGINYPPLHTRCRCTTAPHLWDDYGVPGTRAARDPVTGKTIQLPGGITYKTWRQQYVDTPETAGSTKQKH